jgi:ABC-2 type transport system ATP-binding protein
MKEADELCNRVAIINDGKIVAVDSPDHLKALVREEEVLEVACYSPPPDVESLLRSVCCDAEFVTVIQGEEAKGVPSRIKIIGGNAEENVELAIDALRKENVRITSVNVSMPTLEDAFIKLTGAKLTERIERI